MLRKRSLGSLFAFSAACLLTLGQCRQSEGALLLTVTDLTGGGGSTSYFTNDPLLVTPFFTLGNFVGQADTSSTNYPGVPSTTVGRLSTTLNITSLTGSIPQSLVFSAFVKVGDASGSGTHVATLAEIAGPLGTFSFPQGSEGFVSTSSVSSSTLGISGAIQNTTTVNGVNNSSGLFVLGPAGGSQNTSGLIPGPSATLFQTGTLTGLNADAQAVVLTYGSTFTAAAVPEPASFGMAAIAGISLAAVALRRKNSTKVSV